MVFFFFQAEDGIRDLTVTGVQTCALPICCLRNYLIRKKLLAQLSARRRGRADRLSSPVLPRAGRRAKPEDRKSTRLNSSHSQISYAVFCLKKKKNMRDTALRDQSTHEVDR